MRNPFQERFEEDVNDSTYVTRSLHGDSDALEALVLRHQSWIYNIAFSMMNDIHDAEDATQEVLIKVITKLSTYDPGKASFRTWLYRIVVNHIINMRENRKEKTMSELMKSRGIDEYAARIPDTRKSIHPEGALLEETKISCVQCILLGLERRERIVFILGAVFDVTDRVGSEICDISRDNFRAILSRSRRKVYKFFQKRCSLIHKDNPCKCAEKTRPMIKLDLIDPTHPLSEQDSYGRVKDILGQTLKGLDDSYDEFISLYRDQPFFKGPDMVQWLSDLMKGRNFQELIHAS